MTLINVFITAGLIGAMEKMSAGQNCAMVSHATSLLASSSPAPETAKIGKTEPLRAHLFNLILVHVLFGFLLR